jgi:creatinine amidohydrolase/Fe(II)-dependent formamide hydrolase-like protein
MFVPSMYHREPGPGYSETGVYGDATLATPDKGRVIADSMVDDLVAAAERLRTAPAAAPRSRIPMPSD